jgi:hypothetical protein
MRRTLVRPAGGAHSAGAAAAACGRDVPPGAIAAVGDDVVTQEQFDEIMEQAKAQYASQEGAPAFPEEGTAQYNQLVASIVNYLVQNAVVEQNADELGVEVTQEEIDQRFTEIQAQVGSKKKLDKLLEGAERHRGAAARADRLADAARRGPPEGLRRRRDHRREGQGVLRGPREQSAVRPARDARHAPHPDRDEGRGRARRWPSSRPTRPPTRSGRASPRSTRPTPAPRTPAARSARGRRAAWWPSSTRSPSTSRSTSCPSPSRAPSAGTSSRSPR